MGLGVGLPAAWGIGSRRCRFQSSEDSSMSRFAVVVARRIAGSAVGGADSSEAFIHSALTHTGCSGVCDRPRPGQDQPWPPS